MTDKQRAELGFLCYEEERLRSRLQEVRSYGKRCELENEIHQVWISQAAIRGAAATLVS